MVESGCNDKLPWAASLFAVSVLIDPQAVVGTYCVHNEH